MARVKRGRISTRYFLKVEESEDETTTIQFTFEKQKIHIDMKDALQIGALFMGFLGCVSVVVSLYNNYWRVSSTDGSVITTSTIFENLWMSCADDSSGVYNCWNFQSLLALPGKKNHRQDCDLFFSFIMLFCL